MAPGNRTHYSQPGMHGDAQVTLQESLRWVKFHLSQQLKHWCQGVSASAQCLQPEAFLGPPQPSSSSSLTEGHLLTSGKVFQGLPSGRLYGKSTAQELVSGGMWGQGRAGLQDFNPCSSESSLQKKTSLIHTYLPAGCPK